MRAIWRSEGRVPSEAMRSNSKVIANKPTDRHLQQRRVEQTQGSVMKKQKVRRKRRRTGPGSLQSSQEESCRSRKRLQRSYEARRSPHTKPGHRVGWVERQCKNEGAWPCGEQKNVVGLLRATVCVCLTYRSFSAITVLKVLSRCLQLREAKVADLHAAVLVDEQVGRLQIAMDHVRVAAVKPVHTESSVLSHSHALIE